MKVGLSEINSLLWPVWIITCYGCF